MASDGRDVFVRGYLTAVRRQMNADARFLAALELARDLSSTPGNLERVSKGSSPEAARWAFGQWELRKRARAKFTRADEMLFVREALEQATHERVAEYHGSLFPPDAPVVDLTAGIGADLIGISSRGFAVGFEIDPLRAEYANHNLAVYLRPAKVEVLDSLTAVWDAAYAFADPARRVEGRRTLDLGEFAPDPRAIAERFRKLSLGVMKLSPMLTDEALGALGTRVEFVSFDGECREALTFAGSEAVPGRFAVHVESGERLEASPMPAAMDSPAEYLFDADPAAVRGHAIGTLCERHGLVPLGDSNGYLTGDAAVESPWLRTYRVLYTGKADLKATRRALRELDAATPELKQRGAGLDLIKERKAYATEGKRAVSLVIWPQGRSLRHAIVERQ